jgi:hypothetical protein
MYLVGVKVGCDHGIAQNGKKAQQNGPATPPTDRKKRKTRTISSHRAVRRKAHRFLGQKMALRSPQAYHEGHFSDRLLV